MHACTVAPRLPTRCPDEHGSGHRRTEVRGNGESSQPAPCKVWRTVGGRPPGTASCASCRHWTTPTVACRPAWLYSTVSLGNVQRDCSELDGADQPLPRVAPTRRRWHPRMARQWHGSGVSDVAPRSSDYKPRSSRSLWCVAVATARSRCAGATSAVMVYETITGRDPG